MNTSIYKYKKHYAWSLALCVFLLITAYTLEWLKQLTPCTLCIIQRFTVVMLALCYLSGIFFPWQKLERLRLFNLLPIFIATLGLLVAFRHVQLQNSASLHTGCLPGLKYMLQTLPFSQTLKLILSGSGECQLVQWRLLTLSMAEWMIIFFSLFLLLGLYHLLFKTPRKSRA